MAKRVRAYIGLGANVGDTRANLHKALRAMAALPGVHLREVSPLYRSKPVGVTDQPDFFNAVAALDVPLGPDPETGALALLAALKQLEQAVGRQQSQRWGAREIDLDLLLFGRHRINAKRPEGRGLEVPHAEARNRLFVLAPLSDLVPGLCPPGWHETVASARSRAAEKEGEDAVQAVGKL